MIVSKAGEGYCMQRVWITTEIGQRIGSCEDPAVIRIEHLAGRVVLLCADHAREVAEDLLEALDNIEQ